MIWNNSHQQSSKQNMKLSVKTQEAHLKTREMEVCRKFQQSKSLKKMKAKRRRTIGKGGEIFRSFISSSIFLLVYIKRKEKSKIFLTPWGEITQ